MQHNGDLFSTMPEFWHLRIITPLPAADAIQCHITLYRMIVVAWPAEDSIRPQDIKAYTMQQYTMPCHAMPCHAKSNANANANANTNAMLS